MSHGCWDQARDPGGKVSAFGQTQMCLGRLKAPWAKIGVLGPSQRPWGKVSVFGQTQMCVGRMKVPWAKIGVKDLAWKIKKNEAILTRSLHPLTKSFRI